MTEARAMSMRDRDCVDWMNNHDWYSIDKERDRFVLTEKAPEEARRSFEKWKRINNLDWND